jgi:hypothetical protein
MPIDHAPRTATAAPVRTVPSIHECRQSSARHRRPGRRAGHGRRARDHPGGWHEALPPWTRRPPVVAGIDVSARCGGSASKRSAESPTRVLRSAVPKPRLLNGQRLYDGYSSVATASRRVSWAWRLGRRGTRDLLPVGAQNAASRACTTRLRSMPSHVSQSNASTAVALRPTLIGGSACSASSVRSRSSSAGSAGSANVNGARALHHHPGRTYVRVKRDHDRTQSGHRPAPRAREPTLATPQPGHADAPSGCVSRPRGC